MASSYGVAQSTRKMLNGGDQDRGVWVQVLHRGWVIAVLVKLSATSSSTLVGAFF